jgi:hypothetical protein
LWFGQKSFGVLSAWSIFAILQVKGNGKNYLHNVQKLENLNKFDINKNACVQLPFIFIVPASHPGRELRQHPRETRPWQSWHLLNEHLKSG